MGSKPNGAGEQSTRSYIEREDIEQPSGWIWEMDEEKIRANSLALAWSVTVLGVGAIQRGNLREQLLVFGALKLQSQLVHTPLD